MDEQKGKDKKDRKAKRRNRRRRKEGREEFLHELLLAHAHTNQGRKRAVNLREEQGWQCEEGKKSPKHKHRERRKKREEET